MYSKKYQTHLKKKANRKKNPSFKLQFFSVLLFGTIFFVGVWYLRLVNEVSITGFILSDLENHLSKLQKTNERLFIESQQFEALSSLDNRMKEFSFVSPGEISYFETKKDSSLVIKR